MKNIFKSFIIALVSVVTLTGCTETYTAYTFAVETGDNIKVELNTSKGHDLTSGVPFYVMKDETSIADGNFIPATDYDDYVMTIKNTPDATLIEENEKNGVKYIFYSVNNTEFNYIISINGSNTGVIMGSSVSKDAAKEAFELLTFSVEK
jgi:hypothetical protein